MSRAFDKWQELNELIANGIDPKAHFEKQEKERQHLAKNTFDIPIQLKNYYKTFSINHLYKIKNLYNNMT